jgi:hypothetical protein
VNKTAEQIADELIARAGIGKTRTGKKARGDNKSVRILPPPSAPMAVAREFVQQRCLFNGAPKELTLRYWHGAW